LIQLDLTDDEQAALVRAIRRALDERYPHAPRLDPLKAVLAKLDPPLTSVMAPAAGRRRRRRE
jgi:hypothetical protein